jgi:hypothetical protein
VSRLVRLALLGSLAPRIRLRPAKIIDGSGTLPPDENPTERKYNPLVNDSMVERRDFGRLFPVIQV